MESHFWFAKIRFCVKKYPTYVTRQKSKEGSSPLVKPDGAKKNYLIYALLLQPGTKQRSVGKKLSDQKWAF